MSKSTETILMHTQHTTHSLVLLLCAVVVVAVPPFRFYVPRHRARVPKSPWEDWLVCGVGSHPGSRLLNAIACVLLSTSLRSLMGRLKSI